MLCFLQLQRDCALILAPFFTSDGLVNRALEYAISLDHIMDFTRLRALSSLFSMINQGVRNVLSYNNSHVDFPMQVKKKAIQNVWVHESDSITCQELISLQLY